MKNIDSSSLAQNLTTQRTNTASQGATSEEARSKDALDKLERVEKVSLEKDQVVLSQTSRADTKADKGDESANISNDNKETKVQASSQETAHSEQMIADEEKLTVIKDAISRGEYPLDGDKIAQAFLSLESVLHWSFHQKVGHYASHNHQ